MDVPAIDAPSDRLPAAAAGTEAELDLQRATTLLAREAARGAPRAAIELARSYAAGLGVPRNPEQALAWFEVAAESGEAAPPRELAVLRRALSPTEPPRPLVPVELLFPPRAATLTSHDAKPRVELVWAAAPQAAPVRYFIEVVAIEAGRLRDVFAGYSDVSAVVAVLDHTPGDYAWRVFVVGLVTPGYVASSWAQFALAPS